MRIIGRLAGVVALLGMLALGGIGWHYSNQILTPGGGGRPEPLLAVRSATAATVTLERTEASSRPGAYDLDDGDGGFAQITDIVARDTTTVSRSVDVLTGSIDAGERVSVGGYYYPADPADAFDFPLREVRVDGDLGAFPAYLDEGAGPTWAILVHGRGADRHEAFRMVGVLHDLGVPSLSITYRNDAGAPASPDGLYGLGSTEWEDLEAAVGYAVEHGARRLVLVGFSTGGQIVSTYLHHGDGGDLVEGVILDAPVLDWGPVLRRAAVERGLPTFLTSVAMLVSQVRGIPWTEMDQIERAGEFDVPILLFHGTDDSTVPVATSDVFARARPDLVTYVRVEGAEHVQSWNVDPEAYADAVAAFIAAA